MEGMGNDYTTNELAEIIAEVDANGDGVIDFDEFCVLMSKMEKEGGEMDSRFADIIKRAEAGRSVEHNKNMKDVLSQGSKWMASLNTAESVLLACGVLINLSGIMFQSDRLNDEEHELDDTTLLQRDVLTYSTLALIAFSVIYFVTVFVMEIIGTQKVEIAKKESEAAAESAQVAMHVAKAK